LVEDTEAFLVVQSEVSELEAKLLFLQSIRMQHHRNRDLLRESDADLKRCDVGLTEGWITEREDVAELAGEPKRRKGGEITGEAVIWRRGRNGGDGCQTEVRIMKGHPSCPLLHSRRCLTFARILPRTDNWKFGLFRVSRDLTLRGSIFSVSNVVTLEIFTD
jgi:hypothetical protein